MDASLFQIQPAAAEPASSVKPTLALRTYLGGTFMPFTVRGRLEQIFFLAFIYIAIPALMIFAVAQDPRVGRSMKAALAAFWVILIGLILSLGSILFRLQIPY